MYELGSRGWLLCIVAGFFKVWYRSACPRDIEMLAESAHRLSASGHRFADLGLHAKEFVDNSVGVRHEHKIDGRTFHGRGREVDVRAVLFHVFMGGVYVLHLVL